MFDLFIIRVYIAINCLCQCVSALLRSKTAEIELPSHILTELARCFAKDITAFFAVAENQVAYEKWLQTRKQAMKKTTERV